MAFFLFYKFAEKFSVLLVEHLEFVLLPSQIENLYKEITLDKLLLNLKILLQVNF